jgi:hypothetical protein
VLRLRPGASILKRALVRRAAVWPHRHDRQRPTENGELLPDAPWDRGEHLRHAGGHVGSDEQVREVRVPARAVQVHDLDRVHGQTRSLQDVGLHGDVGDVLVLHPRGRLDLDEAPARALAQQDVHRDEDIVGDECRLVEDARAASDGLARRVDAPVVIGDQGAAREPFLRQLADPVALV